MTEEGIYLEGMQEELDSVANDFFDLIEKMSAFYYSKGFLEGLQVSKEGGNVIIEKKSVKGKGKAKVEKVMHEAKEGKLHSGSKKGPVVKSKQQAIAIALSEGRKAGAKIPKKGKK